MDLYGDEAPSTGKGKGATKSVAANMKDKLDLYYKQSENQIDIENSTVYVHYDIDEATLYDLGSNIRAVMRFRGEDKKDDDINIVINSDGGSVYDMNGIIDYIQSLPVLVNTICRGRACSAAAMLLVAGTGKRYATKRSTIMFHQLSSWNAGKADDIKANARHIEQLEESSNNFLAEATKKDYEWWETKTAKDFFLTPETALELGVIDEIL